VGVVLVMVAVSQRVALALSVVAQITKGGVAMFGWVKKVPWRKVFTLGIAAYFERDKLADQAKLINRALIEELAMEIALADVNADAGTIERAVYQKIRERGIDPLGSVAIRRALAVFLPGAIEKAKIFQKLNEAK